MKRGTASVSRAELLDAIRRELLGDPAPPPAENLA
jgi:hypothetical protein